MENRVKKYDEYIKEQTLKISSDGSVEKQDYELYKDHYSEKYKEFVNSSKTKKLFDSDDVWCLKYKNKKVAIFSTEISEEDIKSFVNKLKNNS